jgi:hypothetical protein
MAWLAAAVVAPAILIALNFVIDHFNFDSDEFFKQEWANNAKLILMIIVYAVLGMTPVCGIIASIMLVIEIIKENSRVSEFCELCRRDTSFTCNYNAELFVESIGSQKIVDAFRIMEKPEIFINAPLITGRIGNRTIVAFDAGYVSKTSKYSYNKNLYTLIAIGSEDDESNWKLNCWDYYFPSDQLLEKLYQYRDSEKFRGS